MRLRLIAPCLAITLLATVSGASAAPFAGYDKFDLTAGDTVKITFLQGGYRVTEQQNPDTKPTGPPDPQADFVTFCIQNGAPIADGGTYIVTFFTKFTNILIGNPPTGTPLAPATAHLYTLFTDNELPTAPYPPNFGPPLPQINTALQDAFYFLQGNQSGGIDNAFAECALGNLTAQGIQLGLTPSDCTVPVGIGDVRVLQLRTLTGLVVQDLLVRVPPGSPCLDSDDCTRSIPPPPSVPEPGSMLLLGTGLFGLAGVIRRRRNRRD